MKKLEILPQYIFEFEAESELHDHVVATLKSEEFAQISMKNRDKYENPQANMGWSGQQCLLSKPELRDLWIWIDDCAEEIRRSEQLQCDSLCAVQAWHNISYPGNWHHGHNHPNSCVSCIYYVYGESGKTWFSQNNIWASRADSDIRITEPKEIIHKMPCSPGKLVMFPSHLFHSVEENNSQENRCTISCNFMPFGTVGHVFSAQYYMKAPRLY